MVKLELPEIETLRRDLERDAIGRRIKSAEAVALKTMPRHKTRKSFEENLIGAKITAAERIGLQLVLRLDNDHVLVIALGDEGPAAAGAYLARQARRRDGGQSSRSGRAATCASWTRMARARSMSSRKKSCMRCCRTRPMLVSISMRSRCHGSSSVSS